jgi:hypothetical protein
MTNQVIPEAAVEAAAMVLCEQLWDNAHESQRSYAREEAREALEAAAPHMLAAAWDDAIEAHKAWTWDDENMDPLANPYRPTP